MQPRTRIGLIVGVIGLVLNICVAGFIGFCGPVLSLVAGGIATAVCFGVIGALLAAGAGALAGYLTTSDQSSAPPPQNIMS